MSEYYKWCDARGYLLLLNAESDLISKYLHVNENTPFLVECAFLNHWNHQLDDAPCKGNFEKFDTYVNPNGEVVVELAFRNPNAAPDEDDFETVIITYTPDPDHPGRHALQIVHNDNVVYQRTAAMNPATEWEINAMAGDPEITDDDGHMLFDGDPVNI